MSHPSPPQRRTINAFTCLYCGCLCDDLVLTIEGGAIVAARNACDLARPRLIGVSTKAEPGGAGDDRALDEAANILRAARAPAIVGLSRSSNETVRKAVALADRIGAVIEVGGAASGPRIAAFQRVGAVAATLGEVKNRADVVVFWGVDPVATHPRHGERYSLEPVGRFTPEGRAGRTVIVIDHQRTATAEKADVFLKVDPSHELALLWTLRGLVRGAPMKGGRVERADGLDLAGVRNVFELLKLARYGAWFSGPFAGRGPVERAEARHQAVTGLVRDLNSPTSRFVAIGMGEAGNPHGAEAVLAWQTGLTPSVDLGGGFPEALPGAASGVGRLARGEADSALVVGDVTLDDWPPAARERLGSIPWVFVGPPENPLAASATAALASATVGLDEDGTVTRVDGVSLPIQAVRDRAWPTERERLASLSARIGDSS